MRTPPTAVRVGFAAGIASVLAAATAYSISRTQGMGHTMVQLTSVQIGDPLPRGAASYAAYTPHESALSTIVPDANAGVAITVTVVVLGVLLAGMLTGHRWARTTITAATGLGMLVVVAGLLFGITVVPLAWSAVAVLLSAAMLVMVYTPAADRHFTGPST